MLASCQVFVNVTSSSMIRIPFRYFRSIGSRESRRRLITDHAKSTNIENHQIADVVKPVLNETVSTANPAKDYVYFKNLTLVAKLPYGTDVSDTLSADDVHNIMNDNPNTSGLSDGEVDKVGSIAQRKPKPSVLDLSHIKPALLKKSGNLAAYANESETLQNLVKLGVDLSKVEVDVKIANHIVKMDFDKDVKPIVLFLHEKGVADADIGTCFTKNPGIFLESMDDMEVRCNYLESKKFAVDAIARIITKMPQVLSTTTKAIDAQLGFLQKDFLLTGDEVRQVVTRYPKLFIWSKASIQEIKGIFKDFLGFSRSELKDLILADPKLYVSAKHALMTRFDYLHNTIGLSHDALLVWPSILRTRVSIVKPRHKFLKFLGRDQYDPEKPNYVSLKMLATGRDAEFCDNVAKVPVKQFNDFLKTL